MQLSDMIAGVQAGEVPREVLAEFLDERGASDLADFLRDGGSLELVTHALDSLDDLAKLNPVLGHIWKVCQDCGLSYEHSLMTVVSYFVRNLREYDITVTGGGTFTKMNSSFVFKHPLPK